MAGSFSQLNVSTWSSTTGNPASARRGVTLMNSPAKRLFRRQWTLFILQEFAGSFSCEEYQRTVVYVAGRAKRSRIYREELSFNQYRPSLKTSEVNKKLGCVKWVCASENPVHFTLHQVLSTTHLNQQPNCVAIAASSLSLKSRPPTLLGGLSLTSSKLFSTQSPHTSSRISYRD